MLVASGDLLDQLLSFKVVNSISSAIVLRESSILTVLRNCTEFVVRNTVSHFNQIFLAFYAFITLLLPDIIDINLSFFAILVAWYEQPQRLILHDHCTHELWRQNVDIDLH